MSDGVGRLRSRLCLILLILNGRYLRLLLWNAEGLIRGAIVQLSLLLLMLRCNTIEIWQSLLEILLLVGRLECTIELLLGIIIHLSQMSLERDPYFFVCLSDCRRRSSQLL